MKEPKAIQHKHRMEGAKKIFTKELENFAKKYDVLSEMTLREQPDIDTMDYIYSFEKVNGTPQKELDLIHDEIHEHMDKFSKEKGIHEFYRNTVFYI